MDAVLVARAPSKPLASLLGRPVWVAAILLLAWLPALSYLDHLPPSALLDSGAAVSGHDHGGEGSGAGAGEAGQSEQGHSEHGHDGGGGLGSGAVPLINDAAVAMQELPATVLAAVVEAGGVEGPAAARPPTPPPR